jgi:D-serine deaminase-like pyridoxal phosphate-dependent protein
MSTPPDVATNMRLAPTSSDPLAPYRLAVAPPIQTPALLIYPDVVRRNIATTISLAGGDADRWRPHVKTAKLGAVMRMLTEAGVRQAKCATTLELRTACEAGSTDVLVAYPAFGTRLARIVEIAREYPHVRVSTLVEDEAQCEAWPAREIGVFVDVNPGMNRTGVSDERVERIVELASVLRERGIEFRGLHYYDGHISNVPPGDAETVAHAGYRRLLNIVDALESCGMPAAEVVTAGTPGFIYSMSFPDFASSRFRHRISPGTVVYGDATSARQLPAEIGYRPAVLVLSTVVSHPSPSRVTCDAGHKTVSADSGVPTCEVLGRPDLRPLGPSEEHLPIEVPEGARAPAMGEMLYLLPRHVCPTVNNFDYALLVSDGHVVTVERVTARGREGPLGSV